MKDKNPKFKGLITRSGKKGPLLAGALAAVVSLGLAGAALAHGTDEDAPNHASAASQDEAVSKSEGLSHRLVSLAARYQKASEAEQASLYDQIEAALLERNALLQGLAEAAPGQVKRLAIPAALASRLPLELQQLLEQEVTLEGTLEVIYVDTEDPADSHMEFSLTTTLGQDIALNFGQQRKAWVTGQQVRAQGLLLGPAASQDPATSGTMILDDDQSDLTLAECCDGAGGTESSATPELSNTLGEQRTLVILANFQNQSSYEPWTKEYAEQTVFGDVSDFFLENSLGQTWLSGEVQGWFTMDIGPTCDAGAIANAAGAAAEAAGVVFDGYTRRIFAYPKVLGCGYNGIATVGGNPSTAAINGNFSSRIIAHELGHNLGLHHSHALDCGAEVLSENCTEHEYGDAYDVMGNDVLGHLNASQKRRLGWLDYGGMPQITAVTSDTVETAGVYQVPEGAPAGIRILRAEDPATGERDWIYLEHRHAVGFDDTWMRDNMTGFIVRLGSDHDGDRSFLLDMTPGSSSSISEWYDGALELGESFTDPESGVTITTTDVGAQSASVSVTYSTPSCVESAPSLVATPTESQWVPPGTAVDYDVTVINNDNALCSPESFTLSAATPDATWQAVWDNASLTLGPGEQGTRTVTLTSPAAIADGHYDTTVTGAKVDDATSSASQVTTYVVSAPANQTPVAVDDSANTSEDTAVVIPVLGNDSDPDGDPLSITAVVESGNGTCVDNGDGSLTYTPNSGFVGTDLFTYTVSDGKGGSATAAVTVDVGGVNGSPIALDDEATTEPRQAVTVDVLANDSDPDQDPLVIASASQGSKGTVSFTPEGLVVYQPANKAKGTDSFTYDVTDGENTVTATVVVMISGSKAGGNGKGKGKP